MCRDVRSCVSTIRPIGHPQDRRNDFSSGRDWLLLSSAALLLLAVQKKAADRLVCAHLAAFDLINPKHMVNGYKLKAGSISPVIFSLVLGAYFT